MIKPIPFRISISKMTESHRETFWLSIEHPDYKAKSILNTDKIGTMTENMSENIDEIRYMALRYAMLFGLSYALLSYFMYSSLIAFIKSKRG